MNKKAASIVALGCICASAATSVNYDLLGRRGSQMNSPMVYKNIDYSVMPWASMLLATSTYAMTSKMLPA